MADVVLINLGRGSLHQGFPCVTVQIRSKQHAQNVQFTGSLPSAPDLLNLYHRWQLLYNLLYKVRSIGLRHDVGTSSFTDDDIMIEEADITHVSETEFNQVCHELQQQLDTWLDSKGFRPLEHQLRMRLTPDQSIRIILQTEDSYVRKLPWYIWQFFQDYRYIEIALGPLNFASPIAQADSSKKMRVLAILGDATGIDVGADQRYLRALKNADIHFLVEPRRREFNQYLWHDAGWDILFFAGHSTTQSSDGNGRNDRNDRNENKDNIGQIFLNSSESLTIKQLHHALRKAIEHGLHLAIFNSCEGLGLATQLADLNIPEVIVMREPVPDQVAQIFLKNFLATFSTGTSLYLSVRAAREQLQGLEGEYPGASWLPVMFQNPAVEPLVWRPSSSPSVGLSSGFWPKLVPIIKRGLLVTAFVMGGRWLGFLQSPELWAFDALMQLRPAEAMDERLLIVTIDGADKEYQKQAGMALQGSLADQALVQVLETIVPHRPAVIGLDIYRDYQGQQVVDPEARAHTIKLRNDTFIDICQVEDGPRNPDEIEPPSEVPIENVGFSDLAFDPDLVVRRQIFGMSPGEHCSTERSFSFLIAERYLQQHGVEFKRLSRNIFQIGSARFQRVSNHSGGYHRLESGGFEILTNYRTAKSVAPTISLQQLLDGSITSELPKLVAGKIVLIGNVDKGDKDYHQIPNYNMLATTKTEVPGVIIHGHMVSHIISATLDNRLILGWWPQWGDSLWVLGWSVLGSWTTLIVIEMHGHYSILMILTGSIIVLLIIICSIGLWLWGSWLPLIPSVLGTVATVVVIKLFSSHFA